MEKQMEHEMETGIISSYIGACALKFGLTLLHRKSYPQRGHHKLDHPL